MSEYLGVHVARLSSWVPSKMANDLKCLSSHMHRYSPEHTRIQRVTPSPPSRRMSLSSTFTALVGVFHSILLCLFTPFTFTLVHYMLYNWQRCRKIITSWRIWLIVRTIWNSWHIIWKIPDNLFEITDNQLPLDGIVIEIVWLSKKCALCHQPASRPSFKRMCSSDKATTAIFIWKALSE